MGQDRPIGRRQFLRGAAALGLRAAFPFQGGEGEADFRLYLPTVLRDYGSAAHGPSKLGLHTQLPNNARTFVRAVREAGTRVALVKAVDEFGYLRRLKGISPETTTVGRSTVEQAANVSRDPADEAARVMALHMPRWRYEADVVDYWEILNENKPPTIAGHVWLAHFFIAAMQIAEANGHKLALFSYSTGVPQWHEWEAIVETGVFARARAGGHALALHEYDWPVIRRRWGAATEDLPPHDDRGVTAGRYRYLYRDFLIPRGEVIPLLITECGLDPMVGGPGLPQPWQERYVQEMIWYDTLLREDDYVVGAAMFTIGAYEQWKSYDYEELLWPGHDYGPDNFFDYIVSLKNG